MARSQSPRALGQEPVGTLRSARVEWHRPSIPPAAPAQGALSSPVPSGPPRADIGLAEGLLIRILIAINGLTHGGAETQILHVARALLEAGGDVAMLTILPSDAHADRIERLGVPVHVLNPRAPRSVVAIARGTAFMRRWSPDVVVSFLYQANVLARVAGRMAGVPVIVSSIRNERFGGRARDLVIRGTDGLATVTTTNSRLAADALVRRGVVPADRLQIIPNIIDTDRFRPRVGERDAVRRELGCGDEDFLWVAVGRMEPQKDFPLLLHALRRILNSGYAARLVIIGDGRLRGDLLRTVDRLDLTTSVAMPGRRDENELVLAAGDALVSSSSWEGLPNVVMEAASVGLPVVATAVGGTPEVVDDQETGYLVPPGDAAALAQAMMRLMDLPSERRDTMGRRGRERVHRYHSREVIGPAWLDVLGLTPPEGDIRATD